MILLGRKPVTSIGFSQPRALEKVRGSVLTQKLRPQSSKHLAFTAPTHLPPPFLRLWLHLQPEEGGRAAGFSPAWPGASMRC